MSDRPLRKVLATWYANESELTVLRKAVGDDVEIAVPSGKPGWSRLECGFDAIEHELDDVDAIIGWVLPPGTLDAAPRLRFISWLHAGVDELDMADLGRRGIRLCNVRGANAIAVAEHGVALLLALAKRLPEKHAAVREARPTVLYDDPKSRSATLAGSTLAILGLGQIGTRIAQRMSGFDMNVIGLRRTPSKGGEHVEAVYGPDDLHDVLGRADFVVLAAPITKRTRAMMGPAEFAAMKPGARLVNVARGNLVDEAAAHEALMSGRLAGFASDVWWNYVDSLPASYHFPTPSRTGLHRLEGVVGSGDQASNSDGVIERDIEFGSENLGEIQRGASLSRAVDLTEGY